MATLTLKLKSVDQDGKNASFEATLTLDAHWKPRDGATVELVDPKGAMHAMKTTDGTTFDCLVRDPLPGQYSAHIDVVYLGPAADRLDCQAPVQFPPSAPPEERGELPKAAGK
jgi:hypothetical protein